jgi:Na+/melibiose symporter-like transporter
MVNETVRFSSKLAYAIGSVAFGVKENGFSTFMMIYFNQVLGLSAIYVGIALLIAMAFDAVTDPWIGHISDRWQGRLGRRHGFMYAAILPAALSYFYLWNPPMGLQGFSLFLFLTVMAVVVRSALTFFEVPNSAMVPELTQNYDQRTMLSGLRTMIGWIGGVVMAVIAYTVFLVPTQAQPIGQLNEAGFRSFAVLAAIVMAAAMLISAVGTHRLIPQLPKSNPTSAGYSQGFREGLCAIWARKPFRAAFLSSLFANMAFGVTITMQIYFGTFYFGLSADQLGQLSMVMVLSAIAAFTLTSWLTRQREKRAVTLVLLWGNLVASSLVILLKFFGFAPEDGSDAMILLIAINLLIAIALSIALQIVMLSMISDLVEDTERETGHRGEGVYLATFSFSRKMLTGLGTLVSGILITVGASEGRAMNEATMDAIAMPYVALVSLLFLIAIFFVRKFDLSRANHEANLKATAE